MGDRTEENVTAVDENVIAVVDEPAVADTDSDGAEASGTSFFDRVVAWAGGLRPWARGLIAFTMFLAAAIAVWAWPVISQFGTRAVGDGYGDAKFYQWALGWFQWSVAHRSDPFYTHAVFAPGGTSLVWSAFTPAAGLLMLPVRTLFGSLIALNTLLILASALACWAAYLVCSRLTHSFWPSVAGGYLFGYSQYMAGHMHGHMNLVLIFPVPLAVYLVIRRVEGSLGRPTFIALMTVVLVTLFLSSTELFATAAFFGAVAFVIALIAAGSQRRKVWEATLLTAGSYLLTAVVMAPFLIAALRNQPPRSVHDLSATSVDLLSFIVPRVEVLLSPKFADRLSRHFLSHSVEDAGYVSIALVVLLVAFAITERRRKGTWGLLGFVAIVSIAALGPELHLLGKPYFGLPWGIMEHAPLIRNATPDRFPAYSALAIAVIAALWLARAPSRTATLRWALVVLAAVMLYPNVHHIGHRPQSVPAFFSDGTYRNVLHPGEVVFAIPPQKGEEMLWQDTADFSFRLAEGYIGPVPAQYADEGLNRGLTARLPSYGSVPLQHLAGWLNEHTTTAIVLDDTGRERFAPVLQAIGGQQVYEGGGVTVWRPTGATWAEVSLP